MTDPTPVERALARLADGPPDDRTTLAAARAATTDLDAAAAFVADGGLVRLRSVVRRTGDGRATLAAFEEFRAACQFRSGRATDLPTEPKDTPD